jgi:hypothetical protein
MNTESKTQKILLEIKPGSIPAPDEQVYIVVLGEHSGLITNSAKGAAFAMKGCKFIEPDPNKGESWWWIFSPEGWSVTLLDGLGEVLSFPVSVIPTFVRKKKDRPLQEARRLQRP